MNLAHVRLVRHRALHDLDRDADDDVQRAAVRHDADVVVEDAAGVEQRHGEAQGFLDHHLEFVDEGVAFGAELVVELVFAKGEHRHEIGTRADRELDEAFASLEHQAQQVGFGVEGFTGAADDDGDGAAHAFVVRPTFGKNVLA